jgi:hypothetical protein
MTLLSSAHLQAENCQPLDCNNRCKSRENEKTNTNLSDCVCFMIIYTRYSKTKVFVTKWNEIYMFVGHKACLKPAIPKLNPVIWLRYSGSDTYG